MAHRQGVSVGVTSIGYDGETIDNVTGLPKPRIMLQRGTIATTSETCIPASGWEMIERTGLRTALGEIVVVRCIEPGHLVLAGPNKRLDLASILERMSALGPSLIFIDGALNRMAPMSVAKGLILATGAARTSDLLLLAKETGAIEALFAIPRTGEAQSGRDTILRSPFPQAEDVLKLLGQNRHRARRVVFHRPVAPGVLVELARIGSNDRRMEEIVLRDPVTCLLAAPPPEMADAVRACRDAGIRVRVAARLPLLAVTVNPFLPRPEGHHYVADAVSAEDLSRIMRSAIRTPVVDIVKDGAEPLWEEISRAT
ncbi:MAG: hypothetical protein AABY75_04615 [Bacteroidota bacterium]